MRDTPRVDPARERGETAPLVREARSVAGGGFRPEIQALRALAVALVVVYHLWPARVSGGYIGVDVFFVVSGFLITSHLLGEIHRTGSVSLSRFWSRRIRRLLPASLTVLAVSLILAKVFVPESVVQQTYSEISASAVYVVNWLLASDSVDYLAAENLPSLVQHYWSLSVEEQFYVFWPVLLLGALALSGLRPRLGPVIRWWPSVRVTVAGTLSVVFVSSLAWSIYLTAYSPSAAYFNTFARAWEFAAGGLVATAIVMWPRLGTLWSGPLQRAIAILANWIGLAMIGSSALILNDESPFPGSVALIPVVGTLLVILGGGGRGVGSLAPMMAWRPVQLVGDWSYAIYLWHWPLIAVYPFVFGVKHGSVGGLSILFISVGLAVFTKYVIEDPVRRGRFWSRRLWPAYALAVVGAILLGSVATFQSHAIDTSRDQAAVWVKSQLDAKAPCFGASALASEVDCADRFVLTARTDLAFASQDLDDEWCVTEPQEEWRSCEYGQTSDPDRTIALVGDSHAAALVPAFRDYFSEAGWKVVTYLRVGCPALSVEPIDMTGREPWEQNACARWSQRVLEEIEARDDISNVVFSNFSHRYHDKTVEKNGRLQESTVAATWQRLLDAGKSVALIRDVPDTNRVHIPTCVGASLMKTAPCAFPRAAALIPDEVTAAANGMADVDLVDLTDFFCGVDECYSVVGDVVVYADDNHISQTYAKTLAPFLGREVEIALSN